MDDDRITYDQRSQLIQACPRAGSEHPVSSQPGYQHGDRIALQRTTDPHTPLQPGDEGTVTTYDPGLGQLDIRWDSSSTLGHAPTETATPAGCGPRGTLAGGCAPGPSASAAWP